MALDLESIEERGRRSTATIRFWRARESRKPLSIQGGLLKLYPALSTLAQIRRDRLRAHVQLYKALGGGWSLTDAE